MNHSRKEGLKTTASTVKHYSEVAQNHLYQVLSILRTSTLVWRNKSQIFSNFVRCLKPNSRQVGLLRDLDGRCVVVDKPSHESSLLKLDEKMLSFEVFLRGSLLITVYLYNLRLAIFVFTESISVISSEDVAVKSVVCVTVGRR